MKVEHFNPGWNFCFHQANLLCRQLMPSPSYRLLSPTRQSLMLTDCQLANRDAIPFEFPCGRSEPPNGTRQVASRLKFNIRGKRQKGRQRDKANSQPNKPESFQKLE